MTDLPRDCIQLLAAMIGIDSVNAFISGRRDAEVELACYLEGVATGMGLATQRLLVDESVFNLLVTHEVDPYAPWLLFESHMDTVAVEGMTIDPFIARIEGGRIYGRGASDTKGSGAAMLWAMHRYAQSYDRSNNIALIFTTDEEIAKGGVRAFVQRHLPALGWHPVGVVVGEPTLLQPVVAHNGAVRWKIHTRGIAAHSSDPTRGRSAISMMTRVIEAIESTYIPALKAHHPMTGPAHCSINVIHGGTQINIVPDHCVIEIDRRVVPGEDCQAILPGIERVLQPLLAVDPSMVIEHSDVVIDPPLDPVGCERFTAAVRRAVRRANLPDEPAGVLYGTDANQFPAQGIAAVVLGPGSIDQAHTKDEWLDLDQLQRAVDVYFNVMCVGIE